MAAAVGSYSGRQPPTPPPRLRIGRKKSHWLLEAPPSAADDDAEAALRRRLAGLGTSELSLFAISEFDSEFQRHARLRRRQLADSGDRGHLQQSQQRPVTCQPRVRFLGLTAGDYDEDGTEDDDVSRPRTHIDGFQLATSSASDDDANSDVASVSEAGDAAVRRFPACYLVAGQLPTIPPGAAQRADARRCAALTTLRAVSGAGDPKRSLAGAFCDSSWLHTAGDFARPRSVTYGQNLRLHPALADSIRAGIIAGRREFESVSQAGLRELDRRRPSLAKTRHDRVVDWLTAGQARD